MLTVQSIAHVAIRVKDLDRSLEFYAGKLGFREMMRLPKPDGSPGVWLVYLRITDDQFLEIFPDSEGERAPDPKLIGYNHMCFAVPDLEASVRELEALGIERTRPAIKAVDGNWQTWIEDPDGHRIELMQMAADGMQAQAIARMRAG
ncbi:VOC family protein [Aureimonas leprariae]|uniref:VOC family protein n=1 Tax=Plantimonas leprariae TaxID=2615207 RepID=A0A7V7PLX2_9HYPH|nr:VOC family protein [Aureimonas leprariae]KAB0677414.1 VOC family protein [Aureimonas leprariae]